MRLPREIPTDGTWRYTDSKTAYNADGLPRQVNDYGQDGDLGTDPADGTLTEVRAYAGTSTISTAKATFDEYGRQLTSVDPLGKTTYTPPVGWPSTGIPPLRLRLRRGHVKGEGGIPCLRCLEPRDRRSRC